MLDIIGYWVVISLMTLPMITFPMILFLIYVSCVLEEYAGRNHRLIWLEEFLEMEPSDMGAWVFAIGCCLAVIEGFTLLITTIAFIKKDDPVHDYIRLMEWMGVHAGPLFGWITAVVIGFVGFHLLLVGYAKCLNLNDKVKAKEKKDV